MAGRRGAPDFASVLRHLRALAGPCLPPAGVGSFEPLYANDDEIVVWYSPAREAHTAGEVAIPCARLAAAWARLLAGERLAREALEADGDRPGRALWLLALLAQVPGVRAAQPPDPLALWWEQPAAESAARRRRPSAAAAKPTSSKRRSA